MFGMRELIRDQLANLCELIRDQLVNVSRGLAASPFEAKGASHFFTPPLPLWPWTAASVLPAPSVWTRALPLDRAPVLRPGVTTPGAFPDRACAGQEGDWA